jgi:O-antigen ligase
MKLDFWTLLMFAETRRLFGTHRLAQVSLLATITIGFFLGYIKDHYHTPINYFLFDIGLAVALFFWLTATDRLRQLTLPRTPLTPPLLLFYAVCFVYIFISGMPLLAGVSAFRGWCMASLAFLLGYDLIQSSRQVKIYLWFVIGLSVISGVYGVYQYAAGIESILGQDAVVSQRHQFATYATEEGELEFRIFSTFVSAGAFGSMMAYASFIALALAISDKVTIREKALLVIAILPMLTSLVLTGTRAALLMMLIGVIILYWYKRRFRIYVTVMLLILAGVQLGIGLTEGRAASRFATLADVNVLLGRLSNPFTTGWRSVLEAPLGHGLGVTGHGVPFYMLQQYPELQLVFSDGDFGRVMVEMGVVGLILLAYIMVVAIKGGLASLRALRSTPSEDVGLAIFGSGMMVGITTLVGSPFLSIPHGLLWWFFMGALFKLQALWAQRRRQAMLALPRHHPDVKLARQRASVSPS